MKYFYTSIVCFIALLISCKDRNNRKPITPEVTIDEIVKQSHEGFSISSRFLEPQGFVRSTLKKNSYGHYLREFPLLPSGEEVHLYDGSLKYNQDGHAAILDIDVGNRDLQQCADAAMRLRAEYLFENERTEEIAFNFTNGWKFEYQKWREGNKLIVNGNKTSWLSGGERKESYKDFRNYLDQVFMYAGTLSMAKELKSKKLEEVKVGDVIIKGGSPGHAVIVVDMCFNSENGDKAMMLAQSYMPAQQIHILKNHNNPKHSPWYLISEIGDKIVTPEWTFDRDQVKSF